MDVRVCGGPKVPTGLQYVSRKHSEAWSGVIHIDIQLKWGIRTMDSQTLLSPSGETLKMKLPVPPLLHYLSTAPLPHVHPHLEHLYPRIYIS